MDELNKVKNLLSDKFLVAVDGKFKASKPYVVSNYVHKIAKIDCFQLELSNHIRTNSSKLNDFIKVFEKIANDDKIIEKNKLDKIG